MVTAQIAIRRQMLRWRASLPRERVSRSRAQQVARRLLAVAPRAEDLHTHEQFMRLAIDVSNGNPSYPFGAPIVDHKTGEVLAHGANPSVENPMLHGRHNAAF